MEYVLNCVSEILVVRKVVEMVIEIGFKKSFLFNLLIESMVVLSDCFCCGVKLLVNVMSEYYFRCEKLYF